MSHVLTPHLKIATAVVFAYMSHVVTQVSNRGGAWPTNPQRISISKNTHLARLQQMSHHSKNSSSPAQQLTHLLKIAQESVFFLGEWGGGKKNKIKK